jgi:hypothetical protein
MSQHYMLQVCGREYQRLYDFFNPFQKKVRLNLVLFPLIKRKAQATYLIWMIVARIARREQKNYSRMSTLEG